MAGYSYALPNYMAASWNHFASTTPWAPSAPLQSFPSVPFPTPTQSFFSPTSFSYPPITISLPRSYASNVYSSQSPAVTEIPVHTQPRAISGVPSPRVSTLPSTINTPSASVVNPLASSPSSPVPPPAVSVTNTTSPRFPLPTTTTATTSTTLPSSQWGQPLDALPAAQPIFNQTIKLPTPISSPVSVSTYQNAQASYTHTMSSPSVLSPPVAHSKIEVSDRFPLPTNLNSTRSFPTPSAPLPPPSEEYPKPTVSNNTFINPNMIYKPTQLKFDLHPMINNPLLPRFPGPQHNIELYLSLGLLPGSSNDDIEAAFKQLAMKYHPDRNPPDGGKMFRIINKARTVLTDPEIRAQYDRFRQQDIEETRKWSMAAAHYYGGDYKDYEQAVWDFHFPLVERARRMNTGLEYPILKTESTDPFITPLRTPNPNKVTKNIEDIDEEDLPPSPPNVQNVLNFGSTPTSTNKFASHTSGGYNLNSLSSSTSFFKTDTIWPTPAIPAPANAPLSYYGDPRLGISTGIVQNPTPTTSTFPNFSYTPPSTNTYSTNTTTTTFPNRSFGSTSSVSSSSFNNLSFGSTNLGTTSLPTAPVYTPPSISSPFNLSYQPYQFPSVSTNYTPFIHTAAMRM